MKTTPTAALEIALGLPPLHLYIQQEAAAAALRLSTLHLWKHNSTAKHTRIIEDVIHEHPLILSKCDRIPREYVLDRHYKVELHENSKDYSGINELRIYTDGSKTRVGTGAGVYSQELNISKFITLGTMCSVYQAECIGITRAAQAVEARGISGSAIRILSDSASVLQSLVNTKVTSGLVKERHDALETIAVRNQVVLQWIKGHSGSLGNDAADALARRGSNTTVMGPLPIIPIPFSLMRLWLEKRTTVKHNEYWANRDDCKQSRIALPTLNPRLTSSLLRMSRLDLRRMIDTITGHCLLNKHLFNLGVTDSPLCRGCMEEPETPSHVLLECKEVAAHRAKILGTPRSLREVLEKPRLILDFWQELGWME